MTRVEVLLEDHELVAVDGRGQWCSCGVVDAAFVEHLADVLTEALGADRYPSKSSSAVGFEAPRIGWREAA